MERSDQNNQRRVLNKDSFFLSGDITMRYHYKKSDIYAPVFGRIYICDHPVYSRCTLYEIRKLGLAVIQQRFDPATKHTWWSEVDPWVANDIYINSGFEKYFNEKAGACTDGLYPTVTVRQIMWALKMKPLKRERWETVFDHRDI